MCDVTESLVLWTPRHVPLVFLGNSDGDNCVFCLLFPTQFQLIVVLCLGAAVMQ